jgi:hypothetical protein
MQVDHIYYVEFYEQVSVRTGCAVKIKPFLEGEIRWKRERF